MKVVNFSLVDGNQYYGNIDGQRFLIGKRVSYLGNKGLMNTSGEKEYRYNRKDFQDAFGFWADFLHPTAMAEGALFHTLNTYDRARFTFTFLQFAAHVPNGDFVRYFRLLLQEPLAKEYFPDLVLEHGRICQHTEEALVPLESDASTEGLMNYLNPSEKYIEDVEIIQSAKLIHWACNDMAHRKIQVSIGVEHIKKNMKQYDRRYELQGAPDEVCLVVSDIRHQGRANSTEILKALSAGNPMQALLALGEDRFPERIRTLRTEISTLQDEGALGKRSYDSGSGEFV